LPKGAVSGTPFYGTPFITLNLRCIKEDEYLERTVLVAMKRGNKNDEIFREKKSKKIPKNAKIPPTISFAGGTSPGKIALPREDWAGHDKAREKSRELIVESSGPTAGNGGTHPRKTDLLCFSNVQSDLRNQRRNRSRSCRRARPKTMV
jgi:hypothetical protein